MVKLVILFAFVGVVVMADEFNYFGPASYERTTLGSIIDISTMKLLKTAYDKAENKNLISSPLGLMLLLSLYNEGTGPKAKREITKFLKGGGNDSKEVSDLYRDLSVQLSNIDSSYLTVANKISVSNNYTLDDHFAATARSYRCNIDTLDFTKPEKAAAAINQWAAEKTQGHLTEPVHKDMIDPQTAVALFNVIFFKGHWHVPFKAKETEERDFHLSRDTVVQKPMMHLVKSLFYTESKQLGARLVELPYKETGFRMVVVLPNAVDGLPSVLEKVVENGLLADVYHLSPSGRHVVLDMPKFNIKSQLNFKDILMEIDESQIFEEGAPGIVKNVPVVVSQAFQEAFIEVDEEGATAGAFTGLIAVPMSFPPRLPDAVKFTVDRPFLYAILHEDKIVFAGTYTR